MQKFTIPGRLDGLNQIISANRENKYKGANLKKKNEEVVLQSLLAYKVKPVSEPVFLKFHWVEANQKRDMDNIASAKKMILDALVKAGILKNDGWNNIIGFEDTFDIDKENPRIEVTIIQQAKEKP